MTYVAPRQDPFRAIADPGRRRLLDTMLERERSMAELTALLGVSQPTVSQHLQVLRLAGLVEERRQGRSRFYRVKPAELRVVVDWLAKYEAFWTSKLNALEAHLAKQVN
jgi:DNA-binding transcriptional ArsR family regulator